MENIPLFLILSAFKYIPNTSKIGINKELKLPNKEIFEFPFSEAIPFNRI